MKKKIALALATILALSAMPMTLFAASDNRVTFTVPSVADKTLLAPAGFSSFGGNTETDKRYVYLPGDDASTDLKRIKEYRSAPVLILKSKDLLTPETAFRLKLTNANWALAEVSGSARYASFDATDTTKTHLVVSGATGMTAVAAPVVGAEQKSFTKPDAGTNGSGETGYKFVATSKTEALISISAATLNTAIGNSIAIPLPMYVEETGKAVTVAMMDNNTTLQDSSFVIIGESSGGTVNTADVKYGREIISLSKLSFKETRLDAIKPKGAFEIIAPTGYKFSNLPSTWKFGCDAGLSLVGAGARYLDTSAGDRESYALYYEGVGQSSSSTDAKTQGVLWIDKIQIEPVDPDNVVDGQDLSITIAEYDTANQGTAANRQSWLDAAGGTGSQITVGAATAPADRADLGKLGVSKGTLAVAKVNKKGMNFSAVSTTIPTLVAGRFDTKADSKIHEAVEVKFNELEPAMWAAANRTTTFTVPEGVLIRGVEFTKTDKLTANEYPNALNTTLDAQTTSYNAGGVSKVSVNGRKLEIKSPTLAGATEKGVLQFKLFLSIDPNYEGSTVDLAVSGSSLPEQLEPVTIANVVKPIEVVAKTTDVQIGFQTFKVSDITIKETTAGNIKKGEPLYIAVDDNEMTFHNITADQVATTNGLKLTLKKTNNGVITFDVDRASSGEPATITISGVEVKIDRTVPYGTYDLLVYGDSVFENYIQKTATADHQVSEKLVAFGDADEGFRLPAYINVKTEGSNSALKANVKIQQDSTSAIVDGKVVELPLAPKNINGRIMVPLKFMANVFGIEDSSITWYDGNMFGEPDNRVATITSGTTTVEFKIGSPIYTINRNGAKIQRPIDNQGTKAFIDAETGRIFLPFAAMGEAFDVPVKWDADSKTAIYNPSVE